jgi:hypothetical protein
MNVGLFWLVSGNFVFSLALGTIGAVAGVALLSAFELRNPVGVKEYSRAGIPAQHTVCSADALTSAISQSR